MPDAKLTSEEIKAILEALIYVSEEPVKQEEILSALPQEQREEILQCLEELLLEYSGTPRGLRIVQVAGGYRMQTRPEHDAWIRNLYRQRNKVRLSRAALETLAIIAYRQPVTSPEIQAIRGANPMGVLQTLLERRLVRTLGRKKVVGKPILYGTTDEFLIHFGLNGLGDLPSLEDFPGLSESGLETPEGPLAAAAGSLEGLSASGPEVRGGRFIELRDADDEWEEDRPVGAPPATPLADGPRDDEEE
ncbi:MAG TPA: SMC-Scp complex subunit ScpB [Candidatus Polarisedimenticolia bacterium]|nr:SMC-Scp complex subunit ScpB [Candidatus Polarisedimenticolia bacterium]